TLGHGRDLAYFGYPSRMADIRLDEVGASHVQKSSIFHSSIGSFPCRNGYLASFFQFGQPFQVLRGHGFLEPEHPKIFHGMGKLYRSGQIETAMPLDQNLYFTSNGLDHSRNTGYGIVEFLFG